MEAAAILKRSREGILAQWDELLRLRGVVLKTSDLDAIHDLRVASRRFRAAIGLFEPWLPPKSAARLKKSARKLTRALGELRNIDEALLFFRSHIPAESTDGDTVILMLSKMRPKELARIEKDLTDFDHRRLDRLVRKAVTRIREKQITDGKSSSLPTYFSATCLTLFQPIHDLLPVATSREQRESRHALRIAIKKWRYFFEIIAPVLESDCSPILKVLKEYQTVLGRMNDVVEFGALCKRLELSRPERRFVKTTLQVEDELLLRNLTDLIAQKPLTYAFPL